ncbi:class I SAM-dependent methyltransferase [Kineococcus sp. NPDC059986]|uniref:class I SAM-dependent DNA methyltransferase n=1 Tax=Kineococcus sp. NPDC059986 TaxID=3155538 RepID=UPI003450A281
MSSASFGTAGERPFYDAFATFYDEFVPDAVAPWVTAVHRALVDRAAERGTLLDAGCGTGRHAAAFTDLGYRVTLLDASAELLAIAAVRCPGSPAHHDDLCDPVLAGPFDGIACRGVLNDLVEDAERDAVAGSFARLLRPGGLLALDVREARRAKERADWTARTRTVALAGGGLATFTSRSRWEDGLLVVDEQHDVRSSGREPVVRDFVFRMRPWTAEELRDRLETAGLAEVRTAPGVGGRSDRLFVTAVRPR